MATDYNSHFPSIATAGPLDAVAIPSSSKSTIVKMPLANIRQDPELRVRDLDEATIKEYTERSRDGAIFPPLKASALEGSSI